jgi:hypothetical protein
MPAGSAEAEHHGTNGTTASSDHGAVAAARSQRSQPHSLLVSPRLAMPPDPGTAAPCGWSANRSPDGGEIQ